MEKKLSKKTLTKSFHNWYYGNLTCFSQEHMQTFGYLCSMLPVVEELYDKKEDQARSMKTYTAFFNTEPQLGTVIVGMTAGLEEARANGTEDVDDETINGLRAGLMGPIAGIGDSLVVGTVIPKPESLGVPKSVIELCAKKRGLVLVTGPTGSGKSTTLASLIDRINDNRNAHVITLEDPIEYLHTHRKAMINQREIGLDTHSYADALRAALREDPDVILVGEMRDLETISTAITAAETGHLVFSTLHTIGAAATIDRIIDVFPPHQQQQIRIQLAVVLEAVISQQLIPTADKQGRVAAFEVMHGTIPIKNLIREAKTYQISSVLQTARKEGMLSMDDALLDLYNKGLINAESAMGYAQDVNYVAKRVNQYY